MKYFQKIASGINVTTLLNAINRQPELWDANPIRTKHPGTAHAQVSDILCRFNDLSEFLKTGDPATITDDREAIPYPAWEKLPQLRPVIFDLMRMVEATRLGRVIITRLPPGKEIVPHEDQGAPATYFERFQIAIQSMPGALFTIGDETVNFQSGDVYWINNNVTHGVVNNSKDDRIALVVDLRCE